MNDTPNDEQQIRDALRGLADHGGPPDEAAAWDRVQQRVTADRTGRNRKLLLGGAGLAVASAAAALVLLVGMGDDQEAVETGPAAESTTTTTAAAVVDPTTTTTGTPSVPGRADDLPAHPLAVVVQDEAGTSHLHVYDADTGALVVRDLATSIFGYSDLSIVGDTLYFTEEGGDSETVRAVPLDGSATPVTPFGIPAQEVESTRAGTLSPDGATFAYVEQGVLRPEGRIALLEVATGDVRYLEWSDDEDDVFLTQGRIDDLAWSPDGARLAFVSSYEGSDIRVIDLDAASLSESDGVELGSSPAWLDDQGLLFVRDCCYPDFEEPREVQLVGVGVDLGGASYSVGASGVASGHGSFAMAELAGGVTVVRNDGDIRSDDVFHFDVEGTVLEVGV
jgi:hypothetical protein